MPTYEYVCRACGHEFEVFHSIMADPISVCPKCRKKKVERMIGTGGAVIFKGGGFYETDYRSESYKAGADADSKAATAKPSESTGSGASDAKAATTSAEASGRDASAKEGTAGKPARDAASGAGADAKRTESSGAEPTKRGGETRAKPASEGKSPADSSAASSTAAENRRIEERATHRSRIGRGVGNIVKKKTPRRK